MAGYQKRPVILDRGDEVEGKVVAQTQTDLILDLGTKSEGMLNKKELTEYQLESTRLGSRIKAYVLIPENDSGQTILSIYKPLSPIRGQSDRQNQDKQKKMQRFTQAQHHGQKLTGEIKEVNKGGLLVEVEGIRGFLPTSHLGLQALNILGAGVDKASGQQLSLVVLEVDLENNRLIFTNKSEIEPKNLEILNKSTSNQKITGKILTVLPFGLVVSLEGFEEISGIIFSQEVAWEKVEDLAKEFKVGQEVEGVVSSVDKNLGRINLSLKQLAEDPFVKLSENYQPDDVVKGTVKEVSGNGIVVDLGEGVEGVIPANKLAGSPYQLGQSTNFLVDNIDKNRRKVNLAPFITSTKGLIYK